MNTRSSHAPPPWRSRHTCQGRTSPPHEGRWHWPLSARAHTNIDTAETTRRVCAETPSDCDRRPPSFALREHTHVCGVCGYMQMYGGGRTSATQGTGDMYHTVRAWGYLHWTSGKRNAPPAGSRPSLDIVLILISETDELKHFADKGSSNQSTRRWVVCACDSVSAWVSGVAR
jgi:hypothetical protein